MHLHFNYKSQNLVLNPSFEDYYNCPNLTLGILECKNVFNPISNSTSDYFNSCAPVNDLNVPHTLFGYQDACVGNAYVGFIVTKNYQEYIQIKLSKKLTANRIYDFSFYLSLANLGKYATSSVNLKFVTDSIIYPTYPLDAYLTPDWSNPKGNFLMDTLNWIKLSSRYKAKGNEEWIIIGSFSDNNDVDTIQVNPNGMYDEIYYYLDGFSLEENKIVIPNIFTPNGDGTNDLFFIAGLTEEETITIYNRWGEAITCFNGNENWNGNTKHNTLCNDGVYYCVVTSNQQIIKTEFIHLLK